MTFYSSPIKLKHVFCPNSCQTLFIVFIEKFCYHLKHLSFNFSPEVIVLIYIFAIACILFLIYEKFKLPLPSKSHVEAIFGPENLTAPSNGIGEIRNESACDCHAYETVRKGFKRTLAKENSICPIIPEESSSWKKLSYSIIGHRGAGMNAPENSLAAIKKCASRGCTMVEFDVSLTMDSVPVLLHDDNLLRVMGVDKRISEITWEELRRIDMSSDGNRSERVPRLEEAVELCLELGMRFIIDIKDESDQLVNAIVRMFRIHETEAYSKGVVSSFYFRVIYKIRSIDPNIVGCMAWRPSFLALPHSKGHSNPVARFASEMRVAGMYAFNDFAMKHLYWRILGLSAVLVHKDALNMELVHRLRTKGLRVFAWTVNCPTEKRYFLNKLQIGYLTDTLDLEDQMVPVPETWLLNNNEELDR